MRLYKRGKTWWAAIYAGGERIRVSTRCHDRAAAESVARQLERDAADPGSAAARRATLGDALKLLLEEREAEASAGRKSQDTVDFYRKKAVRLCQILEGDDDHYQPLLLSDVDAAKVDEYVAARRADRVKDHTIQKELVTLRAALKIALRRGLWRGELAEVMPHNFSPQAEPKAERWLPLNEVLRLVQALPPDRGAVVAMAMATSAELRALERMEPEDILDDAVHVPGTKRSTRDRTVPLALPWQRELVQIALAGANWRPARRRGDGRPRGATLFRPWPSSQWALRRACARAGIEPCSLHTLRHSFGHAMAEAGVPLELVAPMMGHADTRMLERIYARRSPGELARAVARFAGEG